MTDENIRVILHRLVKKGWLSPVVPGIFEYIPAERGEMAFLDTNPLALGSILVSPYTFAYSTAAYYWGLTTQASTTVYLQTNTGKTHTINARHKPYRVISVPEPLFFGIQNADAYGSPVKMTDIEKTVLDCIYYPETSGDIPEIAVMLWQCKDKFDWPKMVNYVLKFGSKSLTQRFGFLLDFLKIEIPAIERNCLLQNINRNKCYLGRPNKWGNGGKLNTTWQIVVNVQDTEILSEIRVG
ncbi:MAG: hypothetical protein NTZ74_04535 [Chloroflexi bacterium]|nr:hypothetical protein [Chloroflexota bacterium]